MPLRLSPGAAALSKIGAVHAFRDPSPAGPASGRCRLHEGKAVRSDSERDRRDFRRKLDLGGCRLTLGSIVGNKGAFTPGYCPPECQSSDTLKPTADSYTVGSTLFHMLTGRKPEEFLGANAAVGGPQSVAFRNWDWPTLERTARRETYNFVRRCLAEQPADRPTDGRALIAEIAVLLSGSVSP